MLRRRNGVGVVRIRVSTEPPDHSLEHFYATWMPARSPGGLCRNKDDCAPEPPSADTLQQDQLSDAQSNRTQVLSRCRYRSEGIWDAS